MAGCSRKHTVCFLQVYGKEKIALDISALKKQYIKLRQRQRQAHIIFSAAVARQPSPKAPAVAMNHLLLGKSALVPAKRLGPPKGAIPPARQPQPSNATLHWKDAPHQDSSSSSSSSSTSSSDTELCDDPDQDDDLEETSQLPEDNRISSPIADGSSDNFGGNEDPTLAASDPPEDAEERDKDVVAEAADVAPQVDTTTTDLVVKISDIFDTTESCGAVVKDAFEFGKYSDSDEENVDFERFLESRVQCLKERSLGEYGYACACLGRRCAPRVAALRLGRSAFQVFQVKSHRILSFEGTLFKGRHFASRWPTQFAIVFRGTSCE